MSTPDKAITESHAIDVLVVDDDVDAAEELVEYLAKAGLKCKPAPDGWAALKLLANGYRPNVVVTDLRMPELTGMEFAERLNRFSEAERPEIIFVSGNAGMEDAIAALRLGARDMLTKPIDGPKLVQAVKSAQLARQVRHRMEPPSLSATAGAAEEKNPIARKRAALSDLKAMRRLRAKFLPTDLFSDPCWEMLLDLYDATLSAAEVTVTSLSAASGVPATTALRRIDELQRHDLIVRTEDKDDKRRTIIRLTDGGLKAVEKFFETYLERRPA
jgi:CheY-like chemotaxis protein/DNA-binding MarR family transcriptional regulator